MNVLITGGAGYIGSVLVEKLLLSWSGLKSVVVYDNLSSGSRESLGDLESLCREKQISFKFVFGDVRDSFLLSRVMKDFKIDAVFHLAAVLDVAESLQKPVEYYEINTLGTLSLLQAMAQNSVPYLVNSSTAAVYGPGPAPFLESTPLDAQSPYGKSKAMAERMIEDQCRLGKLKAINLRYFNVAGASLSKKFGPRKKQTKDLVRAAISSLMNPQLNFEIFGVDFSTRDGSAERDFIHVEDLVEAHLLALHHLPKGAAFETFNVGVGRSVSVLEVIQTLQEVTGLLLDLQRSKPRPGDVVVAYASVDKIQRVLSFQPRHSSLKEILKSAWIWEKELWKS